MSGTTVLVIEDHAGMRGVVREMLERAGMAVCEAENGGQGLRVFFEQRPDLVLLDVSLPEMDGWQVLERIRDMSDVPVVMLTAGNSELETVRGLRAGADDYLTKPFAGPELLARIEALLRRVPARGVEADVHSDEFIRIDFAQRRVEVLDTAVELTPTEFRLLSVLARNSGQVLDHGQLLELVWGIGEHDPDQVKLYISYLRRKVKDAAGVDPVETVRGFGYRYGPRRVEGR